MTAFVPSSARAHAADTDFDGVNVKSNPATGVRNVPPLVRSSASRRAPSSALCGAGVGGRNGDNPLRHPLCQGEVGAVGLAPDVFPVIGSAHIPSRLNRCSCHTCEAN